MIVLTAMAAPAHLESAPRRQARREDSSEEDHVDRERKAGHDRYEGKQARVLGPKGRGDRALCARAVAD